MNSGAVILSLFLFFQGICADVMKGEEVRHFASTDQMIDRFAKDNPKAAQDYEEVMGELMREYEEAQQRMFEEAKLIREGKEVNTKRHNVEYDTSIDDIELYRELDRLKEEQEKELEQQRAAHEEQELQKRTSASPKQPSHSHESEQQMEARLREEYRREAEMEARIRAKIEREMLDKREKIAQRQWSNQNTESSGICLPPPLDKVCDLNIFFTILCGLLTLAFARALIRNPSKPKVGKRKKK